MIERREPHTAYDDCDDCNPDDPVWQNYMKWLASCVPVFTDPDVSDHGKHELAVSIWEHEKDALISAIQQVLGFTLEDMPKHLPHMGSAHEGTTRYMTYKGEPFMRIEPPEIIVNKDPDSNDARIEVRFMGAGRAGFPMDIIA